MPDLWLALSLLVCAAGLGMMAGARSVQGLFLAGLVAIWGPVPGLVAVLHDRTRDHPAIFAVAILLPGLITLSGFVLVRFVLASRRSADPDDYRLFRG